MKDFGFQGKADLSWHNHCVEVSRRDAEVATAFSVLCNKIAPKNYRKAFFAHRRPILVYPLKFGHRL